MKKNPFLLLYHNGHYLPAHTPLFTTTNRSLRYGDGLFETIVVFKQNAPFLATHIKRLQKGMATLKMTIPPHFQRSFFQQIIQELLAKNGAIQNACIRLLVYRLGAGKYQPLQSNVGLLIECIPLTQSSFSLNQEGLTIGLFEDLQKPIHPLSAFKTNNALLYILATIDQEEQSWDDCLLLNTKGNIIEASSSNLFTVKNKVIYTPPLSEACVSGVMRHHLLETIKTIGKPVFEVIHDSTSLLEADEVWLTNAVKGIRWVKCYKTKTYSNHLAQQMVTILNRFVVSSRTE